MSSIKFVTSLVKPNIFMYRGAVLYFRMEKNNLFVRQETIKNKYFDEAIERLKTVLNN